MTVLPNIAGLEILMLMMLAFATLAFTLLAMVTVSNAVRLRNILVTWRAGKLNGFPLFASIFLGFCIFTGLLVSVKSAQVNIPLMLCYIWIAIAWLFSSYQMSKRYITDNGIVKNINDPSQTVIWSSISDFVEKPVNGGVNFVFFYLTAATEASEKHMARLELFVPYHRIETFRKVLDFKLRRRFTQKSIYSTGFEQFK